MDWMKALNDEEDKLVKIRTLVCSDFSSRHPLNISVKQNRNDGSLGTYPTQLLLFPLLLLPLLLFFGLLSAESSVLS